MQKKYSISTNLLRIFHLSNGNTFLLCVRLLLALAAALLAMQAQGVARCLAALEGAMGWFLPLIFQPYRNFAAFAINTFLGKI